MKAVVLSDIGKDQTHWILKRSLLLGYLRCLGASVEEGGFQTTGSHRKVRNYESPHPPLDIVDYLISGTDYVHSE